MVRPLSLSLFVLLLLPACAIDPSGVEVVDDWYQGSSPAVDVVFVVDDSNTMEALQGSLAAAAPALFAAMDAQALQYRVAVVTTDMNDPERRGRIVGGWVAPESANPAATFASQVQVGVDGSQLERGLAAGWAAVTPPLADFENGELRRPEARLALVVVSDEDDCSDEGALPNEQPGDCVSFPASLVSVEEYAARLRSRVPAPSDVAVHALVETGVTSEFEGCGGLNVGTRYLKLAGLLGGMVLPHCAPQDAIVSELSLQLAGRRTRFPLSRTPDPLSISVIVAQDALPPGDDDDSASEPTPSDDPLVGATIPEDATRAFGWTLDAASNTVRLWGDAVPPLGSAVQIRYRVATEG